VGEIRVSDEVYRMALEGQSVNSNRRRDAIESNGNKVEFIWSCFIGRVEYLALSYTTRSDCRTFNNDCRGGMC